MRARLEAAQRLIELGEVSAAEGVLREVLAADENPFPRPPGEQRFTELEVTCVRLAELQERTGRAAAACASWEQVGTALLRRGEPARCAELLVGAAARSAATAPRAALSLVHVASGAVLRAEPYPRSASVLHRAGYAAYLCGDGPLAVRLHEDALRRAHVEGNDELAGTVVENIVEISRGLSDWRTVVRYGRRAAAAASDPRRRAAFMAQYAMACGELGRSEVALTVFEELESKPQYLSSGALGAVLTLHVNALVDLKRYEEAQSFLDRHAAAAANPAGATSTLRSMIQAGLGAPWRLVGVHRVLGMVLGVGASAAPHENPVPLEFALKDYRDRGLTDADRAELEALETELAASRLREELEPVAPAVHRVRLEYTLRYAADVADFELRWRTYRHEVQVRRDRRRLAREWAELRSRLLAARGTAIAEAADKAQYVLDSNILVEVARVFADDGDHRGFAQVAFFLADLLRMETTDSRIAAMAWTMRAKLLHAARRLGGATLPLLVTDLHWSLTQYAAVTRELSGEWLTHVLRATAHHWLDIVADGQDAALAAALAGFLTDESRRAGEDMRVYVALAQSVAGLHEPAAATFAAVTTAVARDHPNNIMEMSEWTANGWAVSRFGAACRDDEACRREYGPFARWVHADIASLRPEVFEHEEPDSGDPPAEVGVGPVAFTDPEVHLVVLWEGLDDRDRSDVLTHELTHLGRRIGQVLRTDDGRWLIAGRRWCHPQS